MKRAVIHLAMAALMVAGFAGLALAAEPPPEAPAGPPAMETPPPPPPPAKGGIQEAIDAEMATRAIPSVEEWRANQHLSWHMCWHLGHRPERYHHHERPFSDKYHFRGKGRKYATPEAEASALRLSLAEIEAEKAGSGPCYYEEKCGPGCPRAKKRTHVFSGGCCKCKCCHHHHHGIIWANEWERAHKRYFWKVTGDIEPLGVAAVPACEGHVVPPPRPVRWNDSNSTCPLPYDTWFKPPATKTVVVPFPLPREGDWRAHISPLMNKIVDQTDWLKAVTVSTVEKDATAEVAPPSRPEGD